MTYQFFKILSNNELQASWYDMFRFMSFSFKSIIYRRIILICMPGVAKTPKAMFCSLCNIIVFKIEKKV